MTESEIDVWVMDGGIRVQRWVCTRNPMPDGSPGVLWRGRAYPLLPDDCIEIGQIPDRPPHHAVLAGEEASWVLIQGLPAALDAASLALEQGGIVIARSGRWLGEPVGGVAFDWFLRCSGRIDPETVGALLGSDAPKIVSIDPAAHAALLEQRIANLLADLARLEQLLRRLPPISATPAAEPAPPDPALQEALEQIGRLQEQLTAQGARSPLPAAAMRLHDAVAEALRYLRPDVELLGDTLTIALGEFASRSAFYRAVQQLPVEGSRPQGWKMLHAAERWWERHVSTGRDDRGRAYARFDTGTRRWQLLLGWKSDQARDIAWLQRQV